MDNLRASLLMVAAMGGFAFEDLFIKLLGQSFAPGQILFFLGAGGALIFGTMARAKGIALWHRDLLHPTMIWRNAGEVIGTAGFFSAVILAPLTVVSAIIQVMPLAVTMGAALVLGETVGWRRWAAILIGFTGVMLIIRPGTADFDPTNILALIGVLGLSVRDLATRAVPRGIPSLLMVTWGFGLLAPLGLILLGFSGGATLPDARGMLLACAMLGSGACAYYMLTIATRIGDMSVVAPYRYSRLVFAMIIGMTVFAERPDGMTLLGAGIVCAAGLYGFMRERRARNL